MSENLDELNELTDLVAKYEARERELIDLLRGTQEDLAGIKIKLAIFEGDIPKTDSQLNEFFSSYSRLQKEKADLEEKLDEVDEKILPVEQSIIGLMQEMSYQKVDFLGVLYWLKVVARPKIKEGFRTEFIRRLEITNEDGIVQRDYINHNTLWGWYNQQSNEEKVKLLKYLDVPETISLNSPKGYRRRRKKR